MMRYRTLMPTRHIVTLKLTNYKGGTIGSCKVSCWRPSRSASLAASRYLALGTPQTPATYPPMMYPLWRGGALQRATREHPTIRILGVTAHEHPTIEFLELQLVSSQSRLTWESLSSSLDNGHMGSAGASGTNGTLGLIPVLGAWRLPQLEIRAF